MALYDGGRSIGVQIDASERDLLDAVYDTLTERAAQVGHRYMSRADWYRQLLVAGLEAAARELGIDELVTE